MNKFVKILISIVILILMILASIFIVKFHRVNKIIELMKKNSEIDNYLLENDSISKKRYENIIRIVFGNDSNLYYYYDFDVGIYYIIDKDNNIYYEDSIEEADKKLLEFPFYSYLTNNYTFKNKLKLTFLWKIKIYDKTKYQIITENNDKIVFDGKTGVILKVNDENVGSIIIGETKRINIPDLSNYTCLD